MKNTAAVVILILTALSTVLEAENVGFVRRQGTQLELNGKSFYFHHSNQYYLFYKSQASVDEVFADASGLGLNVFRVWGYCDGVFADGYSFQPSPGVYDEATFRKMDYILYKANQLNIRLVISLVNNWDDFGGMAKYVEWSPTATWHDQFYTDSSCKQWYKNYISYFLNRVNTYTGVKYKDDPTVMMWELANEPRCQSDTTGDTLQAWIDEMSAYIKSIDPLHLVSSGSEGWYSRPNMGNDWRYNGEQGVDFIRNDQSPFIDICSFHMYPNDWSMDEAGALTWINEHISDAHAVVQKPVFAGEFGWRAVRSSGSPTLADFVSGTDGFAVDWGYSSISRTGNPSYNGNGSLKCRINLKASSSTGGIKKDFAAAQDFSAYSQLTAWVYLPFGAPSNLRAEFYVKSTPSWRWADGADSTLVPGSWTQVRITSADIAGWGGTMADIRQIGVQIKRGTSDYNSFVYHDLFEAGGAAGGNPLDARNRIYADWYNLFNTLSSDGAGFWLLSGHMDNGQLYPDYDGYTVYYPEDASTTPVIQNYSAAVVSKSTTPLASPSVWDPCESVGTWAPGLGFSDATAVSLSSSPVSEGSASIRLSYGAPVQGKAYIENPGPAGGLNESWAAKRIISVDVYNPGAAMTATVAVSTGSNWDWHESITQPVKPGWNTIVFHLDESTWKSAATAWQNNGTIANLSLVKRLSIGLFGYTASGSVQIDNIRLY